MPAQMFLRTAQTEQRIEDLEKQVQTIMNHLGLNTVAQSDLDAEWEAAKPPKPAPEPEPEPEPEEPEPPKLSKIAQKVAKRR